MVELKLHIDDRKFQKTGGEGESLEFKNVGVIDKEESVGVWDKEKKEVVVVLVRVKGNKLYTFYLFFFILRLYG